MTNTSAGRREQDEQHGSRARGDLIAQPHRVDAEVGLGRVRLRMLLDDGAVHRAQFGAGRLDVGARREPAEHLRHPMLAAGHHRRRQMMRAGDDVGDELGLRRIRHRRLEHADDDRRPRAETDRLARGPSGRRCSPVVQNRWVSTATPAAFGPSSPAFSRRPSTGRRPMTSKYEPSDDAGAHLARFAEADHREGDGRELAERREALQAVLQIDDFRHRERRVLGADARARSGGCRPAGSPRG